MLRFSSLTSSRYRFRASHSRDSFFSFVYARTFKPSRKLIERNETFEEREREWRDIESMRKKKKKKQPKPATNKFVECHDDVIKRRHTREKTEKTSFKDKKKRQSVDNKVSWAKFEAENNNEAKRRGTNHWKRMKQKTVLQNVRVRVSHIKQIHSDLRNEERRWKTNSM